MTIRFACPNCEATIGAADEMIADRIECPRCLTALFVPDPTAADVFDISASEDMIAEEAPVSFGSGRKKSDVEMDMTPMVDVTFLLLIFFMVTAAFSLQKSFQIPAPKEDRPSSQVTLEDFEEDEDYVIVRIDENSTFYISAAHWEDEREAPSKQDLLLALKDARSGADPKPTRLLVMAHADSWHEKVVMAMDVGTAVGMNDVKLVTVDDNS